MRRAMELADALGIGAAGRRSLRRGGVVVLSERVDVRMSAREVERLYALAGQRRVSRSRLLRHVLCEAAGEATATASAVSRTRELLGLLAEHARAGDAAAARAVREHWRDRGRD